MEEIKRIYALLLRSNGLRIRDIATELGIDKFQLAETMFSEECVPFWYVNEDSLWFAKEGAIEIEDPEEDQLTAPIIAPKVVNTDRFLQGHPSAALRSQLSHLSKYRVYSEQELTELFRRYRDGDKKARDLIVMSHQKLVAGIAILYTKYGLPLEDLIQEGNIGLINAIERFDYINYRSFHNYARSWILQSISASITSHPYIVRLPPNQYLLFRKVRKFKEKYEQINEIIPSTAEIEIGEDVEPRNLSYLDSLPDDLHELVSSKDDWDDYPSEDFLADEIVMKEANVHFVNILINKLSKREAEILRSTFGIGAEVKSLSEIGERINLTRERVRQIKEKAIRKLKKILNLPKANKRDNYDDDEPNERTIEEIERSKQIQKIIERAGNNSHYSSESSPRILYSIENKEGRFEVRDKYNNLVVSSEGNIKQINGRWYCFRLLSSYFNIYHVMVTRDELKVGALIIHAARNSHLYQLLIGQQYDKIQDIKLNYSNQEYKVFAGWKWYNSSGLLMTDEIQTSPKKSVVPQIDRIIEHNNTPVLREVTALDGVTVGTRIVYNGKKCTICKILVRGDSSRFLVKYDNEVLDNLPNDKSKYFVAHSQAKPHIDVPKIVKKETKREIVHRTIEKKQKPPRFYSYTPLEHLVKQNIITRKQLDQCHKKKLRTIGDVKRIIEHYQLTPHSTRFTKYTLDMWFGIIRLLKH